MSKFEKILDKLFRGSSDSNFAFDDLILILKNLGFDFKVKGSHNIFIRRVLTRLLTCSPNLEKQNRTK